MFSKDWWILCCCLALPEWVSCCISGQKWGYEWCLEDKRLSLGNSWQAASPEELHYSCVFMSGFSHHGCRQTLVQICSSSGVMISTFGSQGEAACNLPLPNIPTYLRTWFDIFFLSSHQFSHLFSLSLSLSLTYCLQHSQSVTLMHTVNAAGMWDVDSMWPGLVLAPFSSKSPRFRICFYSPMCQGPYSKLTRKNLSPTCRVFPGGRNVKYCAWTSWVIINVRVLIGPCHCSPSQIPGDL